MREMKEIRFFVVLFFIHIVSVACSKDEMLEDARELNLQISVTLYAENSKANQSAASYGAAETQGDACR